MTKITGYQVYYDNGELYDHSSYRGDTIYTNKEGAIQEIQTTGFTRKTRRKEYIDGTLQEVDVYMFPEADAEEYGISNDYSMVMEVDILLPADIKMLSEQKG